MKDVLPKKAKWIKDSVSAFEPESNKIVSNEGHVINYEYMIVSTGLQLNFDAVYKFFIEYILSYYWHFLKIRLIDSRSSRCIT